MAFPLLQSCCFQDPHLYYPLGAQSGTRIHGLCSRLFLGRVHSSHRPPLISVTDMTTLPSDERPQWFPIAHRVRSKLLTVAEDAPRHTSLPPFTAPSPAPRALDTEPCPRRHHTRCLSVPRRHHALSHFVSVATVTPAHGPCPTFSLSLLLICL